MKNNYVRFKIVGLIILILGLYAFTIHVAKANTTAPNKTILPIQQEVEGVVTGPDGLPMPGVTVAVIGENRGTVTNLEGNYSIRVGAGDTLVFSHIGFKTVEEPVNGRSHINIQLEENISALQTVEINAGYYNTTRRESTGNISRITAEAIEKQPVTNPLAAMQGRMPGVQITQTTGVPGGGFDIQIRGRNSIRPDGNYPLYIINGVPYTSQPLGDRQVSTILSGTASPLNNIDPDNIASIEVLKDADATAIYGSRGANGVVLITTKKGKPGKTQLNLNVYSGFGGVTRMTDLMNTEQYLEMRREAYVNDGISEYPANAYDVNGTWDQDRYTDWQEVLIGGTAETTNIQASITGGNRNTQFLLSGGYHHENTVFPGDFGYGKASTYLNLNHQSENDKFNASFSASYVVTNNNLLTTDLTREAGIIPPNAPPLYDEAGNLNWANSTWQNPLRLLEGKYLAETNSLIANAVLSYELVTGLEFKTNLGFTTTRLESSRTIPSTVLDPAFGLGSEISSIMVNNSNRESWIIEPQLDWEINLGEGRLNLLAGATFQQRSRDQLLQFADGFSSNSLIYSLSAASNLIVRNNDNAIYKYHAIFGRINYNLLGKYILNITGRRDGSSRFGPGNRFTNFAAIGAAWIFSEEDFISNNLTILSFGKLRGSYGTTGNDQIGDYQFLDTYSSSGNSYQDIIGLRPTRLFNPSFGWEINKKMEVALELGLLENRIFLSTAYYRNRSSNQLVGVPLPGTTGFPTLQANLGATVQNTGLEVELRTVNFQKENFNWTTSFNISVPRNKLVEFPGLEGSTYANQYIIGEPLNIRKVYGYTGLDPQTGVYQFVDFNEDGAISSSGDRELIVHTNPKFFGGLNNSFSYNNWDLDLFLQFVSQKGSNYLYFGGLPGTSSNRPIAILDRWQMPGDEASIQRYTAGYNAEAARANSYLGNSDAAFSDASFARLKNISLSYTLPEALTKIFNGRLYLQGQNLLTITNYKGADPENPANGILPPLRIFTAGVQLTF